MNLNQVTVPSLDVEKSILFYKKLGLNLIVKALPHYARFECPEGDSTFSIHLVSELPSGQGVFVYFETDQMDEKVNELINEQGIIIKELPEDKSWLWRKARLNDPDGNQIIIYHAGNNRKNPPWRYREV